MDESHIIIKKQKPGRKAQLRPCACGTCRRCKISRTLKEMYTDGHLHYRQAFRDWTTREDQVLKDWMGRITYAELAQRLLDAGGGAWRTKYAIWHRCAKLGISISSRHFNFHQLREIFGVTHQVLQWWVESGWLHEIVPETKGAGQPGSRRLASRTELERFIRTYPWLVESSKITDRRLQRLAEVQDRYVLIRDVAKILSIRAAQVRRLIRAGLVQVKPFYKRCYRIRVKDIPSIKIAHDEFQASIQSRRVAGYQAWLTRRSGEKAG